MIQDSFSVFSEARQNLSQSSGPSKTTSLSRISQVTPDITASPSPLSLPALESDISKTVPLCDREVSAASQSSPPTPFQVSHKAIARTIEHWKTHFDVEIDEQTAREVVRNLLGLVFLLWDIQQARKEG